LLSCLLSACASEPSRYRGEAYATLERVKGKGGESLFPAEFKSVLEAWRKGEALQQEEEDEEAESYFYLTLMKGSLLEKELREEKARSREAARRADELKKAELEARALAEAKRLAESRSQTLTRKESGEAGRKKAKAQPEHVLVSSYTVKRGESLPLIASQPEVYGDRNLWPLIYRANRDQISDPRHIWPGQVLQVPHNNIGRDDIAEARRYAQERPLH
jgi:nucleoid-associated protein YgaU